MPEPPAQWWRSLGLEVGLVFVVALIMFAYLQPPTALADPDSFYHAGLTTMLRDEGLVRAFPWTQESLYRTLFIDHHLGYHLLLIPFVSLWSNELAGLKVATVLFAALSVTAAAWILRRWRVPWWGLGVGLLLTTAPFIFRLSLTKAPSLAIGLTLVGYYLITERKLGWLVWWSWLFVWCYSAWPLLMVLAVVYILAEATTELRHGLGAALQSLVRRPNLLLLGSIGLGYSLGVVTNPYWPVNVAYLTQLFAMALVPYHKLIGIGGEWYPYNPFDLPQYLAYPLLAWLVATLVGAFSLKRQTTLSRATWWVALLFLAYTFRARRQAEYAVPFMALSAGLMFRDAGAGVWQLKSIWHELKTWLPRWLKSRLVVGVIGLYLIVAIPWGLTSAVKEAKHGLRSQLTATKLQGPATWLRDNSPLGAVVFQTDWGTFPVLWYHNRHNYYLTGLDQTFMYEANPTRYWLWLAVVRGERRLMFDIVRDTFGASYLIVEKRLPATLKWIARDGRFRKMYEDPEAIVYALPR